MILVLNRPIRVLHKQRKQYSAIFQLHLSQSCCINSVSKPTHGSKFVGPRIGLGSVFLAGKESTRQYSNNEYGSEDGEVTVDEQLDDYDKAKNEERMFVIQPEFKWGKGRFLTRAVQYRLDEAEALVKSVRNWKVHHKTIESLHDLNSKSFFGKGKLEELKAKVDEMREKENLSAVFLNTGKLSRKQTSELQNVFGCKLYDRYRIVLEIFKERARTKEAKLQVRLAELNYMRWHLTSEDENFDQQRGGLKSIGGSGETQLEVRRRVIWEKIAKIKKELHHVEVQRKQNRTERLNKHVPQVALIGYTNAGKTTLARALSGDSKLEPEDKLFATLDTTAHRGKLPCGIGVVYIDTVGFITDLPHDLIQSFSATLEDVKNANLLVHVRDLTNPENELQKKSVMEVLESLNVDKSLMDTMIEVHNKSDLSIEDSKSNEEEVSPSTIPVSALKGSGIEDLKYKVEKTVFELTGRKLYELKIDPVGKQLSWLHQHTTVLDTIATDNNLLEVQAIMDHSTYSKWQAFLNKGH